MNGNDPVPAEGPVGGAPSPGLGWKEVRTELVEFFASIKLAMFLFLTLAMASTIGTVLQQNEQPDVYIKEYGEVAYQWFVRLSFIDIYHSWWFTSLLALLCVNSLTCFYKRFPAVWRSTRQDKVNVSLPFIKNMRQSVEIPLSVSKEVVGEGFVRMLAEKGYRVIADNKPGEATVYATKGIMGRVGAHMAHLSATVIVLGGMIGSVWGFQNFGVCLEGETYRITEGNFDLRVDKFWIDYHENGSVKSHNSTLAVIDDGKEALTKTISVNEPLVYKGIWFYQSSYGNAWDRVNAARVNIKDRKTAKVIETVDLEWKKEQTLQDLGIKLAVTDFVADFGFNSTEKKVFSKTVDHENPAVKLAIWEGDSMQATPWIFYHYPDLFEIKGSQYDYELVGYRPQQFTGLQITKDPGVNIVWVGSTMIVVGITLSSFVFHRRLWAKIIPNENGSGVVVHLGGNTHKSQIDFQKEFRKMTERLRLLT